jgi:DNA-binding XRE family transcriptional regulator
VQEAAATLPITLNFAGVITMNSAKLKKLQAAGWKVGSAKDFLKLTDEEAMLVELKVSLAGALRQARVKRGLSQVELAQRMRSSQSRVAKIEAGDASVSMDLIIRALLAAGATRRDLQRAFAQGEKAAA